MQQTPCSTVEREPLYVQARLVIDEALDAAEQAKADLWKAEDATVEATRQFQKMMIQATVNGAMSQQIPWYCPRCGWLLGYHDAQQKKLITRAGEVDYTRGRYRCGRCGEEYVPVDLLNSVEDTGYTLGARMVVSEEVAGEAYAGTSEGVKPEIEVSRQEVARIVAEVGDCRREEEKAAIAATLGDCGVAGPMPEGEGVVLTSAWQERQLPEGSACCIELDGGKFRSCERGEDGKFQFREGRVGLIAVTHEGKELPKEKAGGKLYVARVALLFNAQQMVELLYAAYLTLPAAVRALPVVFIADGGPWWEWVAVHFPQSVRILDIRHAGEHLLKVAALLFGEGSDRLHQWRARIYEWLKEPGKLEQLVEELRQALPADADPAVLREWENLLAYLEEHREHMRYWEYEAAGLPIGSGAVESAVDLVIEERLRERGRRWRLENADRMMCLRAMVLSGELRWLFERRRAAAVEATRAFLEPLQQAA
jgi:hypothetical protein